MARFYLVVVESFRFASRSVGQLGGEGAGIGTGIGTRIGARIGTVHGSYHRKNVFSTRYREYLRPIFE
jgi:hypothetical protein